MNTGYKHNLYQYEWERSDETFDEYHLPLFKCIHHPVLIQESGNNWYSYFWKIWIKTIEAEESLTDRLIWVSFKIYVVKYVICAIGLCEKAMIELGK